MIDHKNGRACTAALAAALMLTAATAADAAHVSRGPTAGMSTAQPSHASPNWGYGRGWCYWHPRACSYRSSAKKN
jgi:hypothetical protein